jgi:hypothetical protein
MQKNRMARMVIVAIVAIGAVVVGGLHYFAEVGQFTPASTTNGATKADQRPVVDYKERPQEPKR